MRIFYGEHYLRAGHAFDTTRKALWVAESLSSRPIPGIELVDPEPASPADLRLVHDAHYIESVRTGEPRALAESQGFVWDAGLWEAVCASTGGVIAAAQAAMEEGVSGSLSSGLHHAKAGRGDGFCTFNGLALALVKTPGARARQVAILDFDAHCGGGTYSLISGRQGVRQADVAVDPFDAYQPDPPHTLTLVADARAYLGAVATALESLNDAAYDLCLYNAGMDPHEGCDIGGLVGITREILAERERMVFAWCREQNVPVAFVLAGGYVGARLSRSDLVALHRLTLEQAAGQAL